MGIDTNPQLAPEGHADWLAKGQIAQARQPAALAINAELVQLYACIGRDVLQCQQAQGWGAKVIERLALGLNEAFPDRRGSWSSNLKHLRLLPGIARTVNWVSSLLTNCLGSLLSPC